MEKNPHLAKGFNKGLHKFDLKDEWNKVADHLNKYGPPMRKGEGWLKVWADYKFKLKKKLVHNKAECRATGGGPFKQYILTPTEDAASKLLQLDSIINPGQTFGTQRRLSASKESENSVDLNCSNEESCGENEEEPLKTQPATKQKSSSKRTFNKNNKTEKNELLSEQLKVQTQLYSNVKRSLSEIERYSRKTYKLKEEKLKLYKEELKRKEDNRKFLMKIKLDEIDIKRRKIELEECKSGYQT